jgi:chromate transporter
VNEAVAVFLEFLRFGALSFGGGIAMITEIKRVLVTERGWLEARVFIDGWSLGQFVPGPNMLAMLFYGYRIGGVFTALLAWLGMFAPGALLGMISARVWVRLRDAVWAKALRATLLPVGLGLSAGGVLTLAQNSLSSAASVVLALIIAGLVYTKRLSLIAAVFVGAACGALMGLF